MADRESGAEPANGPPLCHVTTQAVLDQAGPLLHAEPFLHCCTEDQLAFVMRQHFAGRTGLLILRFDPACITGEIRWEPSEPGQAPFPHLYGRLPIAQTTISPA